MNRHSADISRGSPWVVISVPILALALAFGAPDLVRHAVAVEEPRIEIVIRDFKYVRTKMQPVRAGVPMVFVIHNEDSVRHGFISPLSRGALFRRRRGH